MRAHSFSKRRRFSLISTIIVVEILIVLGTMVASLFLFSPYRTREYAESQLKAHGLQGITLSKTHVIQRGGRPISLPLQYRFSFRASKEGRDIQGNIVCTGFLSKKEANPPCTITL